MTVAANYIVLSIPLFFLLIGIEIIMDKLYHTGYYRLNDGISNINAGITEQVSGAFAKFFIAGVYILLYERLRLFSIPQNPLSWIILFLGVDFFYYWFHRYAHEVHFLWGGHVVHHQSEEYNLSVALRQGAFQKFGSFVFYLPLALLGFSPVMFIVVSQVQTLYQFWIHTKMIGKMHPAFEFVFNTPSHHRVHHGRNPAYLDKNHGGTLIIWDRLFGTFCAEREEVVYGTTQPLNSWNPLTAQLAVWVHLFNAVASAKGLRQKWQILIKPPGWHPGSGQQKTTQAAENGYAPKYDVSIPTSFTIYVFVHFLLALGLAAYFLFAFDTFDIYPRILIACAVIFSITVIGGLLELRRWAFVAGLLWLFILPALLWYLVIWQFQNSPMTAAGITIAVICIASAIFLIKNKQYLIR